MFQKKIQLIQIIHVNNTMHYHMISYYFCCHEYFTAFALHVICFIILSIQSIIIGHIKVRSVFVSNKKYFHTIQLIPYFQCTHIHTSSLTSIIFILGFISFLPQLLFLSHTLCSWKNIHNNQGRSSCSGYTNSIISNST